MNSTIKCAAYKNTQACTMVFNSNRDDSRKNILQMGPKILVKHKMTEKSAIFNKNVSTNTQSFSNRLQCVIRI